MVTILGRNTQIFVPSDPPEMLYVGEIGYWIPENSASTAFFTGKCLGTEVALMRTKETKEENGIYK
jgi:hypothetical protein